MNVTSAKMTTTILKFIFVDTVVAIDAQASEYKL